MSSNLPDNTPAERRYIGVDYLLTTAARFDDKRQKRGLPVGFIMIVAEGDGGYTHHVSNPDDGLDWFGVIGCMDVVKNAIINTNLTWEPVNKDGTELSEEELAEFYESVDDEEDRAK